MKCVEKTFSPSAAPGPGQVPKLPPRLRGDQPGCHRPLAAEAVDADSVETVNAKDRLMWVDRKLSEGRESGDLITLDEITEALKLAGFPVPAHSGRS